MLEIFEVNYFHTKSKEITNLVYDIFEKCKQDYDNSKVKIGIYEEDIAILRYKNIELLLILNIELKRKYIENEIKKDSWNILNNDSVCNHGEIMIDNLKININYTNETIKKFKNLKYLPLPQNIISNIDHYKNEKFEHKIINDILRHKIMFCCSQINDYFEKIEKILNEINTLLIQNYINDN